MGRATSEAVKPTSSQRIAPETAPASDHLSVRPPDAGPAEVHFQFEQQQQRLGGALGASVLAHAAFLGLLLLAFKLAPDPVRRALLPDRLLNDLVWLSQPGPGGGGGGGNKSPDPPKKAELPGQEKITVPAVKPEPTPEKKEEAPVEELNIPAQTMAADISPSPGVIDSSTVDTTSTGSGSGGGGGSGQGSGLGVGSGGGTGGGVYRMGNGVENPQLISQKKPSYTSEAMRASKDHDLLSMLMAARDEETGEGMSDAQLRDEAMTIFLAGHETTAVALGWTWHLLGAHPVVRQQLEQVVDDALGGRPPTMSDLPRLGYVEQVVKESMRLYPPAWVVSRRPKTDDVVGGFRIPAGAIVLTSPYVTHRHPEFWPDPTRFDPDRFDPAHADDRPAFAYFPFGGGPRQCIGNTFAMMELVLVVATIAQRCRLDATAAEEIGQDPAITLRPAAPITMRVRRRAVVPV